MLREAAVTVGLSAPVLLDWKAVRTESCEECSEESKLLLLENMMAKGKRDRGSPVGS